MSDMFGLNGKVAIVWGGGQGMGEASARRLASAGADIAVVDIELARAETVAAQLRALGRRAVPIAADATDEAQANAAVAEAEAALGPIDAMVTVIGIGVWSTIVDMTLEQWQEAHRLNSQAFFLTARAVARSMIAGNRPGAIACVASVSGMTSAPKHAGYGAAKAGIINLVRTMAVEWGPHNIRVNAISPGTAITPRVQPGPEATASILRKLPMPRLGTTDDIGKAALFLVSDLAGYITGHTLPVDGGWMSTFLMYENAGPAHETHARGL